MTKASAEGTDGAGRHNGDQARSTEFAAGRIERSLRSQVLDCMAEQHVG
jgi:hypothetical protein